MIDIQNASPHSPLLKKLFSSFNSAGISYCLWKGRVDLGQVLVGNDDVDILVARKDSIAAYGVLLALDFKLSQSGRETSQPGLVDYFAYDPIVGLTLHIQVYHQLICGERLIENLHLPIEDVVLKNRVFDSSVPFPAPAAELTVFIIRKIFQNGNIFLRKCHAFSIFREDVAAELEYLLSLTSFEEVEDFVSNEVPVLNFELLGSAIKIMQAEGDNVSSVFNWLKLRHKVMSQLRDFQRRGFINKNYEWVCRRLIILKYKIQHGSKITRLPASGGRAIAIVGSDGTGKSTAVNFLLKLLSPIFQTSSYHMGRPKPSMMTRLLSNAVRFLTKLSGGVMRMPKPGQEHDLHWPNALLWLPMLLSVSIARDRYITFRKIRRDVSSGKCVIIDRYPVQGIEWMDSPMIHRINGSEGRYCFLTRKEKFYYDHITIAEQTILLIVSPEVAAERQISDGYEYVIARAKKMHEAVSGLDDSIVVIDTSCSLKEVQARLIEEVWSRF
mgnify:CR=1 FL=1